MPNRNLQYQQSISAEFDAIKDRVRFFIEDNHWGEDGHYKEVILINYLRKILPESVGVGTGFVKNNDGLLTNQIDIIIYNRNYPKLFSEGDFVILMPESVLGIVEVKSKANHNSFTKRQKKNNSIIENSTLDKCHRNGEIIGRNDIFNGIFSYDTDYKFSSNFKTSNLCKQLNLKFGRINHICFNQNYFMRYWDSGNPVDRLNDNRRSYSFYNLASSNIFEEYNLNDKGLAFGYFISNLLEIVYSKVSPTTLNEQYFEFLYPLRRTKEPYRLDHCEIKITNG